MINLPRGTGDAIDRDLATARFQRFDEVELLSFQGNGSLFLGATPPAANQEKLVAIYAEAAKAMVATIQSDLSVAQRIETIKNLEQRWRDSLLYEALPIGHLDDRHAATLATTRGGKGTDVIIPNLCVYPGSIACLDPKGENAARTWARRGPGLNDGTNSVQGMGQTIHVFDPFGVADVPDALRSSIDPLALIKPDSDEATIVADTIAESLIIAGDARSAHWDENAQVWIKGVSLHLVTRHEKPSLITLRKFLVEGDREGWKAACKALDPNPVGAPPAELQQFLRQNPNATTYLMNQMADNDAFDGIIAGAAETLQSCGPDERGGILSTARRNTAFLDTRKKTFVDALESTTRVIDPSAFKKDPHGQTLYLVMPVNRMNKWGRLLRCVIGLLLEECYRELTPPASGFPVLFLLDEFVTCIGYMTIIEKAAAYAAGFGVKLWFIIQDISAFKAAYPKSYQSLLSNAGMVQVFGLSVDETSAFVSEMLGETEVIRNTISRTVNDQFGTGTPSQRDSARGVLGANNMFLSGVGAALFSSDSSSESLTVSEAVNQQIQIVPLLRRDEIARYFSRESGAQLIMIKGQLPVWALRVHYYDCPWFKNLYVELRDPSPP